MLGHPGQSKLLIAIFSNNLDDISTLLQNSNININYIYGGPYNDKTALEISCCEFIATIHPSTIKLLKENGAEEKQALYSASYAGRADIVKELIKHESFLRKNPILLSLIRYIADKKNDEENYLETVKILVEKVDLNLEDDSGSTVIHLAAKFGFRVLVDVMLKTRHEEIYCEVDGKPPEVTLQLLLKNIRQRQEKEFLNNHQDYWQKHVETIQEDNYFLLLFASEKGLINIVRYFLYTTGVNPNKIVKETNFDKDVCPLKYACVRGFYEIVNLLLKYSNSKTVNLSLMELVRTKFEVDEFSKTNHKLCLELLLDSKYLDLTYKDDSRNTVCHYSAMHQNSEVILMVLRKGGSLTSKNNLEKMVIMFLNAEILEKHFDDCIRFGNSTHVYGLSHSVEIDFKSMLPDKDTLTNSPDDVETNFLEYISTQRELKKLLHHPVIDMFLFLKWQRVKKFIFLNLLFYIIFMVLLFIYIYTQTVMNKELLEKRWFFIQIIKVALIIFWLLLIFREVSQIFVFRIKYFQQYENWIEACLFTATGVLIFKDCQSTDLKNQLSALIIVTSSVELMLLSGRHFKIFFVSSIVLQTVSTTLFKWLSSYIILIGSFSFGFYYLFHGQRFFKNIYISLFKTIVMVTGEFELENFDFANNFLIGPILFILFVFLVNIVLLGVCTALAINDIQLIINDAETKMQIVQIQHIVYWELTLYTSRMYNFGSWFQRILKIKLLQEEPVIKVRVDNSEGFQIIDRDTKLEIDSHIVKKIIAKNEISNKFNNKQYPTLNEDDFYKLRETSKKDSFVTMEII